MRIEHVIRVKPQADTTVLGSPTTLNRLAGIIPWCKRNIKRKHRKPVALEFIDFDLESLNEKNHRYRIGWVVIEPWR